jgi:hypothetical protein
MLGGLVVIWTKGYARHVEYQYEEHMEYGGMNWAMINLDN